jgi:hypothetical protein
MSFSGGLHSTVTVVGIEVDGLRLATVTITKVDAEQTGSVITDVVVVLHFQQVVRVRR